MTTDTSCVLFSRSPYCKNSKTRIRNKENFSNQFVDELHTALVLQTLNTLTSYDRLNLTAYWHPSLSEEELELLSSKHPQLQSCTQKGNSFSNRFLNALLNTRSRSPQKNLILVGSDCPYITSNTLAAAVNALDKGRLAWGPDDKNGFYLVGIPGSLPIKDFSSIFKAEKQAEEFKVLYKEAKVEYLETLSDIDTSRDLIKLKADLNLSSNEHLKIFEPLLLTNTSVDLSSSY